ncbi:MAG: glyoxalase [Denitrovibrio sp.]|nr:MAG: glyoxalase [Denitrovibrio sp.]
MNTTRLLNNLMVENVVDSLNFYISSLGFELVMAVPEGTEDIVYSLVEDQEYGFAVIKNGDVELMFQSLSSIKSEFPTINIDAASSRVIFYMQVIGIDELFASLEGKVDIVKGLHEAFYGMKEFYIKDFDGYILGFAEKA